MELDTVNTLGPIEKGINPDIIGAISPKRKFALVYKGEIVAQGNRYDKAYQRTLMDLKQVYHNESKLKILLEEHYNLKYLSEEVINHANLGEFSLPANPKKSLFPGKMKSGGHGQENIDFLEKIGRKYKVEHTYKNGVRIGAVDGHKSNFKMLEEGKKITGQSWFPKSWTSKEIKEAGRFVIENNFEKFKKLEDGKAIFDNFDGVRVGVMKTKGKPATIFPDNAKQPRLNSSKFEINPIKE